jgi:hypothetical protein
VAFFVATKKQFSGMDEETMLFDLLAENDDGKDISVKFKNTLLHVVLANNRKQPFLADKNQERSTKKRMITVEERAR